MGGGLSINEQKHDKKSNIRFLEFSKFESCGRIPRAPDDIHLTTDLDNLPSEVTLNNCFVVFVSHRWTRAGMRSPGFDGRPEADSKNHDKYKLCVSGIKNLWESYARDMKYCYLWFDYACLNQNVYPARELESLADIMQMCDCLFTPVVDENKCDMDICLSGKYRDYFASQWSAEPEGYIHRSWCRLELYYGGYTPLSSNSEVRKKYDNFTGALRVAVMDERRPHFLYNTAMCESGKSAVVLPPPQRSYFSALHPLKGFLTKNQDSSKIKQLTDKLLMLMKTNNKGAFIEKYVGEYNEFGQRHGYGKMIMPFEEIGSNGESNIVEHTYDGEWVNNEMDGTGKFIFGNSGHTFTGTFSRNRIHGYGKHLYSDGSSYEGQCDGFKRVGYGVNIEVNGDKYEGEYVNDFKEGHGKLTYANGNVYEGYFKDDLRNGFGFYTFAGGEYEGGWQNDKMHGQGTCRYINGDVYTGMWNESKLHGAGEFIYANGDVYRGEFVQGKEHGQGMFRMTTGEVYEGSYLNGTRYGFGKQTYRDGKVYEGEFVDDKMCGTGSIKYPDGSSYHGGMKDGMKSGEGTLITEDGDCIYHGFFKLGKKHGRGVLSYQYSGDVYEGEWVWDVYTQIRSPDGS